MREKDIGVLSSWLIIATILFSFILASTPVLAEESHVDNVSLSIPTACTMTGTGMNSHTATIPNGTLNSNIGETTIKAYCNDPEGFAIYAIGYTDNTDGKNVLTSSSLGSTYDIATGTATSGNNSNWAMKLFTVTSPTPTYPITIENSFNSFHNVPNDYTLAAKRTSATDTGENAEGSTLKSTYQTYISNTQAAGNYIGRVKYVLVHPNNTEETPVKSNQIAIIYDGNGLTFQGGASTNKVVYGDECTTMYEGNPVVSQTGNMDNNGNATGPLDEGDTFLNPVTVPGADMLKVELKYNAGENICFGMIGTYEDDENYSYCHDGSNWGYYDYRFRTRGGNGTETIYIHGDTVTFDFVSWWDDYDENNTWGYFAKVYPLYESEQLGSEGVSVCGINHTPENGSYATTTTWNGKWYMTLDNETIWLADNDYLLNIIEKNKTNLLGTTIYLYSLNPYKIVYDGNNATAGAMNSSYVIFDLPSDTAPLIAPNYYKTNYGFAGWSEKQNATANGSSRVYGPNEEITSEDLSFNRNSHEVTLYAVWVQSAGTIQNWNGCSSLGQGRVTALTDSRDGQTYAIAKLADGNCWMIENLRLDATNSSDSTKAQGFGGVFTGLANAETSNFSNSTTSNSKYSTSNITGSYLGYRFPRYNNANTSSPTTSINSANDNIYGYGNHYTWAAAMANTNYYSAKSASESANTSICPSGWRLPYGDSSGNGNTSGGFYYLDSKINTDPNATGSTHSMNTRMFPNNFVYSSYFSSNKFINRGIDGYYWSSSARSYANSYAFYLYKYNTTPYTTMSKPIGMSVRCLTFNN